MCGIQVCLAGQFSLITSSGNDDAYDDATCSHAVEGSNAYIVPDQVDFEDALRRRGPDAQGACQVRALFR